MRKNFPNMVGNKYGLLTVIEYVGSNERQQRLWKCRCDCGNEKITNTRALTSGHTRSCGCLTQAEDLTGKRFGRIVVEKRIDDTHDKNGVSYVTWLCKCDCGNYTTATSNNLKGNHVKSCGCLAKDTWGTIGYKHGLRKTRLYRIYNSMKQRCNNPNIPSYRFYGARGIKVCPEWDCPEGLDAFGKWALSNGYREDLTIDRIDVNGNYEPSNCRWVSYHEQFRNTRRNVFITYQGETLILSDWGRKLGIDQRYIGRWLKKGLEMDEIIEMYQKKGERK